MQKQNKVISIQDRRSQKNNISSVEKSQKDTPISKDNTHASVYWAKKIATHRIYVDTCSLMHEEAPIFFEVLRNAFKEYNKKNNSNQKLIVAGKVIAEVKKHISSNDSEKRKSAEIAKGIINNFFVDKIIEVREDPGEHIADNVFLTHFTRLRVKDNLCLITQDGKLSVDVYNLNRMSSVNTRYSISIVKITKKGDLVEVKTDDNNELVHGTFCYNSNNPTNQNNSRKPSNSRGGGSNFQERPQGKTFKYMPDSSPLTDEQISVTCTPSENDTILTSSNGKIKLGKKIAAGGEGAVYEIDNKTVCKIYFPEKTTKLRFEKIKKMLEVPINNPSICWPIDIAYNTNNEFVGYLMPKAKGKTIKNSIFFPQVFKTRSFPNWDKSDLVQLCITVLEGMEYLHKRNIIIGDISGFNILVESSTEVYFVDTDSFQIERFPCPVGLADFTAPEIIDKDRTTFLRNFGHEYFAVASLLFMLLLPGKAPYSKQGGGNIVENIKAMDFAYPYGTASNGKTPDGAWRFIWSNFPNYLKQAFYETFRYGQPCSSNSTRKSSSEWLSIMKRYKSDLDRKIFDDEEMYKIFATRLKLHKDVVYKNCPSCGVLYPENQLSRTGRCRTCNDTTGQTIRCVQCNKDFEFTYGELDYYKQKNLSIPKTCKACRTLKSQNPQNPSLGGGRGYGSSSYYSGGSTYSSGGGSSYSGGNSSGYNGSTPKSGGCLTSILLFIVPIAAIFTLLT